MLQDLSANLPKFLCKPPNPERLPGFYLKGPSAGVDAGIILSKNRG